MSTYSRLFGLLGLLVVPFAASAEGGYVGVSIGSVEVALDNITAGSGTTIDDETSGHKIYGGYNVDENFGLEFAYVDFGDVTLNAPTGAQFTSSGVLLVALVDINMTSSADAFTAAAVGRVDLGMASLFGKLGLAMWDSETTSPLAVLNSSDDGTDLFFGFGVDVDIIEGLVARFEYEMYELDKDEVDMMSLGLHMAF